MYTLLQTSQSHSREIRIKSTIYFKQLKLFNHTVHGTTSSLLVEMFVNMLKFSNTHFQKLFCYSTDRCTSKNSSILCAANQPEDWNPVIMWHAYHVTRQDRIRSTVGRKFSAQDWKNVGQGSDYILTCLQFVGVRCIVVGLSTYLYRLLYSGIIMELYTRIFATQNRLTCFCTKETIKIFTQNQNFAVNVI